ncbi:MAG: hypothetical protein E7466_00290 [Ruminococcaceae bacterium]|nr:hypothetical protein [Oscillospiraceae bacterium]MBQ3215130.1 hypothetical protein [Oscillospiraceae bacterium]
MEDTEWIVTHMRTENAIITIRRPVLTPEERARRMEGIKKAAVDMILATERNIRERERRAAEGGST